MKKPKIIDKRQIHLEEILKEDYIPFLGGRPGREKIINREDVLNLTILLNTSESVEHFLNKL